MTRTARFNRFTHLPIRMGLTILAPWYGTGEFRLDGVIQRQTLLCSLPDVVYNFPQESPCGDFAILNLLQSAARGVSQGRVALLAPP